jgi:hypothetical protein
MTKDTGGAAFPVPEANRLSDGTYCNEGMTLRDWFAGQALAGMLAANPRHQSDGSPSEHAARASYMMADAMLAERSTGPSWASK